MSNRRRFLDRSQLTPQQRSVAVSAATVCATRLQERLRAFVELSVARDPSPETGPLAFLPYAAKDLFLHPTISPAAAWPQRSSLIVRLTLMRCAISMKLVPRALVLQR